MMRFLYTFLSLAVAPVYAQKATDIVVTDQTLVQRCVIKGEKSRMIAVGNPGGFNYAFDALQCKPAFTWKGDFLNFSGEINGRGGYGVAILGVKQPLGVANAPLRIGTAEPGPKAMRFRGYRRNRENGAPTFLFDVDGVPVEQTVTSGKSNVVSIGLTFPEPDTQKRYYLLDPSPHIRIGLTKGLRWSGSGVIEIPSSLEKAAITIHLKSSGETFVRTEEILTGAEIFQNFCSACHSTDGTKLIGPTFKDFWGHEKDVTRNGVVEKAKVDADYVRESILKPQAAIVKGYEAVPMADFSPVLTKEQVDLLVEYLSEL